MGVLCSTFSHGWLNKPVQSSLSPNLVSKYRLHTNNLTSICPYLYCEICCQLKTMSVSLSHILQTFAGKIEVDKPAQSVLIKLIMTYPIERDFSCQEAAYIILGLPLIEKSFKMVAINLSGLSWVIYVMLNTEALDGGNNDEDDGSRTIHSDALIERYINHSSQFKDVSLYDILESYKYKPAKNDWQ